MMKEEQLAKLQELYKIGKFWHNEAKSHNVRMHVAIQRLDLEDAQKHRKALDEIAIRYDKDVTIPAEIIKTELRK